MHCCWCFDWPFLPSYCDHVRQMEYCHSWWYPFHGMNCVVNCSHVAGWSEEEREQKRIHSMTADGQTIQLPLFLILWTMVQRYLIYHESHCCTSENDGQLMEQMTLKRWMRFCVPCDRYCSLSSEADEKTSKSISVGDWCRIDLSRKVEEWTWSTGFSAKRERRERGRGRSKKTAVKRGETLTHDEPTARGRKLKWDWLTRRLRQCSSRWTCWIPVCVVWLSTSSGRERNTSVLLTTS